MDIPYDGSAKELKRERLSVVDPLSAAFSFPSANNSDDVRRASNSEAEVNVTRPATASSILQDNSTEQHQSPTVAQGLLIPKDNDSATQQSGSLNSTTANASEVNIQTDSLRLEHQMEKLTVHLSCDASQSVESEHSQRTTNQVAQNLFPLHGSIAADGTGDWLLGESLQLRVLDCQYVPLQGNLITGTLLVTSFKLQFVPSDDLTKCYWIHQDDSFFRVPLGCISQVSPVVSNSARLNHALSSKKRNGNSDTLVVKCKDMRHLVFKFTDTSTATRTESLLQTLSFPKDGASDSSWYKWLFAFCHRKDTPKLGWVFDITQEFTRQGALQANGSNGKPLFRITSLNHSFQFAETYPAEFIVPSTSGDLALQAVGKFRSKARIPALSWYDRVKGGSIWRCSQPKVGIGNTCVEDERMIDAIRLRTPCSHVSIMDCRPYKSAVANKAKGMGFEDVAQYQGCSISFHNIENIHTVRSSYRRIESLATKKISDDGNGWLAAVESSGWVTHIRAILVMAVKCAEQVGKRGIAVLLHCSDGWDRTAQVLSLAQMLLDPYCRTIKGFQMLLEKDWLSFGHKFKSRLGHGSSALDDTDRSPVFLQFLECVWQLGRMFPKLFQFNAELLSFIGDALYSCRFGDFLSDSMYERTCLKVDDHTLSLWDVVTANQSKFMNPSYFAVLQQLHPRASVVACQVVPWEHLFKYAATPIVMSHAFQNSTSTNPFL